MRRIGFAVLFLWMLVFSFSLVVFAGGTEGKGKNNVCALSPYWERVEHISTIISSRKLAFKLEGFGFIALVEALNESIGPYTYRVETTGACEVLVGIIASEHECPEPCPIEPEPVDPDNYFLGPVPIDIIIGEVICRNNPRFPISL